MESEACWLALAPLAKMELVAPGPMTSVIVRKKFCLQIVPTRV